MSKVIVVNLTDQTITQEEYQLGAKQDYGRGLALKLLKKHVPANCGRLDPENALIYTPGLFAGNRAPSATRGLIMSKGEGPRGLAVTSITGDMPQKMGSLDIASLVIKGRFLPGNGVVYVDKDRVELMTMPELENLPIPQVVERLRSRFGSDCALTGVGKAGDMQLPLASIFVTYPEGVPRFYCPRSGVGDIPGSKGLRAVVVKCDRYFDAPCAQPEGFAQAGKEMARLILDNDICGGALPGLGSITLLHLLKNKEKLPPVTKRRGHGVQQGGPRVNYCCAPMCVIGCLNRHSSGTGEFFAAPEESEVRAALKECFHDDDFALAKGINAKGFELGLNTTEFVYTARMYFQLVGKEGTREDLFQLMEELEQGSLLGRLIGGGTAALARLYLDRPEVQKEVTKPSVAQESQFQVKLEKFYPQLEQLDDMDLLYREVFVLENLGYCMFSSFATLNSRTSLELLAQMASEKFGETVTALDMLRYAGECIQEELDYQRDNLAGSVQKSIPEFIKVLYRYFQEGTDVQ